MSEDLAQKIETLAETIGADINALNSGTTTPSSDQKLDEIISILSSGNTNVVENNTSNTTIVATSNSTATVTIPTINFLQSKGMNAETGKAIFGIDHLRQSLLNMLTTTRYQRVKRRTYGSGLDEKIDYPARSSLVLEIYSEIAETIETWEPRFELKKINTTADATGRVGFDFEGSFLGQYISTGKVVL